MGYVSFRFLLPSLALLLTPPFVESDSWEAVRLSERSESEPFSDDLMEGRSGTRKECRRCCWSCAEENLDSEEAWGTLAALVAGVLPGGIGWISGRLCLDRCLPSRSWAGGPSVRSSSGMWIFSSVFLRDRRLDPTIWGAKRRGACEEDEGVPAGCGWASEEETVDLEPLSSILGMRRD